MPPPPGNNWNTYTCSAFLFMQIGASEEHKAIPVAGIFQFTP